MADKHVKADVDNADENGLSAAEVPKETPEQNVSEQPKKTFEKPAVDDGGSDDDQPEQQPCERNNFITSVVMLPGGFTETSTVYNADPVVHAFELMKRFLPHRVDVLNDTEEGRRSLAEIEKRKKAHEKRQKQGMRKDDNE